MSQRFVLFGRVQSSQLWTSVYNHHLSDPMRRAAIRAFRTARRYPARRTITTGRVGSFTSSHATGLRSASSSSRPDLAARPVNSSMYFRRFSVALASTLVGYGAWYGYQNPAIYDVVNKANPFTTSGAQIRSFTSTAVYSNPPQPIKGGDVPEAAVAEPTRKAIIVTADSIYTGSIEGDEPISKYTGDDSGRKVLEMITPKQATEKLRKSEESYFVGRGKGVVRYDVVQMPSNDPIEDDHSEKIVEVPQSSAAAAGQDGSSDWMFWGVYDGHR
jgi:pyruvate dehydrogenase phosphatase